MSEQNNLPTASSPDRPRRWLPAILAVALIARIVAGWHWRVELSTDRDGYLAIAEHLLSDRGYSVGGSNPTAFRPPLYPLLLAVISVYGGDVGIAVLQILLGTVTVWLTARIGRNLSQPTTGLFAAGIVAVDPLLLRYTPQLMTETLFTFLVALLMLQITRLHSDDAPPTSGSIALGVTFGLCALCRPTIWAFGGLAAIIWLLRRWRLRGDGKASGISYRTPAIIIAATLITVAPWVIRNTVVLGRPVLMTTHGGYTLLLGNNPVFYEEVVRQPAGTVWSGDSLTRWQRSLEVAMKAEDPPPETELERDRWMFNRAVGNIRADPGGFTAACWLRLRRFWNITPSGDADMPTALRWAIGSFYAVIFLAAIVGLWRLDRTAWQRWWPASVLLLSFTAVHLLYWSNTRMRAPLVPVIALLAARGMRRQYTRIIMEE